MVGHKICFYGEIWLIIPKLFLLPFLIWSTAIGTAVQRSMQFETEQDAGNPSSAQRPNHPAARSLTM